MKSDDHEERGIEARIKEAILRGEFENLSGKGKPLNLDEYFETPEDLRVGFSLLKSNGFVPPEVEIRRELLSLRERLTSAKNSEEKGALESAIRERQLAYDLLVERAMRRGKGR